MSTPEPESVQRLPSTMVLPERRGPPTSSGIHPGGVRGAIASQTAGTCAGPDVESEFGWTLVVGAAVLGMPDFLSFDNTSDRKLGTRSTASIAATATRAPAATFHLLRFFTGGAAGPGTLACEAVAGSEIPEPRVRASDIVAVS